MIRYSRSWRTQKTMKKEPAKAKFAWGSPLYFAGICAVLLVLLVNLVIMERQEPWEDEVFAVSTGWSLARTQGSTLSVLADYPRSGSPIHFYGPVSFEVEAWLIRVFGLSMFAWRFACFLGILLCILVCSALVKLAGGDKWAQLTTALFIALAGSVAASLPGRWDSVTAGLFLWGLLLFLRSIDTVGTTLLLRSAFAGVPIGFALASSPRALTLCLAAFLSLVLTAFCIGSLQRALVLGTISMFSMALLVHTLLLLPWGLNSLTWYLFLRRAAKTDYINATPLTGRGMWILDLQHHKLLALLFLLLLIIPVSIAFRQDSRRELTKWRFKLFLTLFASVNLMVMLLLVANALGQTAFWLPPAIVAVMCWIDWEFLHYRGLASISAALIGVCLLLLCVEEAEQTLAVALTWNRRSMTALTAFVRENLPPGSVVYGPIGSYFYPVELSGSRYLYSFEHTTPGLYSEPSASIGEKLDKRICSSRTYAMWPKPDLVYHPQERSMPDALRERLQAPLAEFNQPALARWKVLLLQRIGEIGGKYGFPDVVLYTLESRHCEKD
jgi:hypothetical protein